jgi:hypothetical protein
MENQKVALSHSRPQMEIELYSNQVRTSLLMLIVPSVCSAVTIWNLKQMPKALYTFTSF